MSSNTQQDTVALAEDAGEPPKSKMMRTSLTDGSIANALYLMAMPMAVGILAHVSFNIVDTLFVSELGGDALAALSFTFPVVMIAMSLSVGLGAGTSTVVAIAAGKHDEKSVRELTTDAIVLTFLITVLVSLVGIAIIDPLFLALGATPEVLPLIRDYMVIWFLGIPLLVTAKVGMASMRALGNTKL